MTTGLARAEHVLIVPDRWQDDIRIDHPPECPLHTDSDRLKGVMTVRYDCDVAVIVQTHGDVAQWFLHRHRPEHRYDHDRHWNGVRVWPGRYIIECATTVHDAGLRESSLGLARPPEGERLWGMGEALFKAPQERPCAGVVASGDGTPGVFTGTDGNIRCRRCGWRVDEHDDRK